jgi:hypothetical protein
MKRILTGYRLWLAVALVCAGLFCAPRGAGAMYVSGNDLVNNCMSERKQDIYACVHYVAGVIDYHTVMQSLGTAPTLPFCIPAGVSITEAAFVVLTYLRNQPQHEGFIAAMAVPMALNKKFPCKRVPAAKRKKK